MRLAAGSFRETITIRRLVQEADTDKDLAGTPLIVCRRRARFITEGGKENQHRQQVAQGQLLIEVLWDKITRTIDPQMDILHGSRVLAIVAVEDVDGLHEIIRITCVETKR